MIPAALWLIPAIAQIGMSVWQRAQARKYGKAKQPEMPIPTAALEALNSARTQANQVENPFASMQRQQLGQNVSQGMDALSMGSTSGTDILGGVNQLANQNQQGILGIGQQNIAYEQESEHNLTNMLQNMANLQNQQWQTNVYQPWQQKMATSSAMLGASQQNFMGGLQSGLQGYMAGEYLNSVRNPVVGGGLPNGANNNIANQFGGGAQTQLSMMQEPWNNQSISEQMGGVINPDVIIDTRGLRTPIKMPFNAPGTTVPTQQQSMGYDPFTLNQAPAGNIQGMTQQQIMPWMPWQNQMMQQPNYGFNF